MSKCVPKIKDNGGQGSVFLSAVRQYSLAMLERIQLLGEKMSHRCVCAYHTENKKLLHNGSGRTTGNPQNSYEFF